MGTRLRHILAGVALGAMAFGAAGAAKAGLGVDFSPPPAGNITSQPDAGNGDAFYELGYSFTANAGAVVTGLGTWVNTANPFTQPQQVGLWDSSGNLLAEVTVTSSQTEIGSAPWVFTSIAPLALTAGDTYVVASIGGADYASNFGPVTYDSHITYNTDAYGTYFDNSNPSLFFPTQTAGLTPFSPGFFGGNIELSTTAIPEPSTWAMLLLGFGGLAFAGCRARKGVALAA